MDKDDMDEMNFLRDDLDAANERIKELENQLSPLSSATPSYVAGLNERIKALEDALRSMLEVCKDPKSYDFVKVSEIIRTALEVKP